MTRAFFGLWALLLAAPTLALPLAQGDVLFVEQDDITGTVFQFNPDGSGRNEATLFREGGLTGLASSEPDETYALGRFRVESPTEPGFETVEDALVRIDPTTGDHILVTTGAPLGPIAFSPSDGVLVGSGSGVTLIDTSTGGQTLITAGAGLGNIKSLAMGAGNTLYAVRDEAGGSQIVSIDLTTGIDTLLASGGFIDNVNDIVLDTDGNLLAVGLLNDPLAFDTREGGVLGIDVGTGDVSLLFSGGLLDLEDPIGDQQGNLATQVAVSPFGQVLVAGFSCFSGGCSTSPAGQILAIDRATGDQSVFASGGLRFPADLAVVLAPEPGTGLLVGAGLIALGHRARRRKSAKD